jgi:Right handed beta helix region
MRNRSVLIIRIVFSLLTGVFVFTAGWSRSFAQAGAQLHSPGATTYYVDSAAGDDQHDGKAPDKAWKSLDRVNSAAFAPGDKILFKAGSRFEGRLAPKGSGKEGAPIVIDAYGEGAKPLIAAGGRFHEALLLENQEFWEVNNLEFTNQGETREKFRYGVRVRAWDFGTMHHIHLKNLFVHDVNGSVIKDWGEGQGIVWENGGKDTRSRFDDLLIEGCHLLRTDRNGICGYSAYDDRRLWYPSLNVVIRNNLLEDIGGDGIKVWGCEGALVEHNRLDKAGQRAPDYSAGIWPWSSDGTVIQFNEVSEFKGTRDGQAFDSDGNCRGTIFQYNYSHDNDGGFMLLCTSGDFRGMAARFFLIVAAVSFLMALVLRKLKWRKLSFLLAGVGLLAVGMVVLYVFDLAHKFPQSAGNTGTVVRYNISQNDRARTFHITGPIKDASIYNNVFYVGKDLVVDLFLYTDYVGWSDGIHVKNNIFYVEGTGRYSHGVSRNADGSYNVEPGFGRSKNNLFEGNVFYGNHENPPEDPRALTADPMLVAAGSGEFGFDSLAGYKLKDGSPCIGAGIPIQRNGGRDFWGNRVPEGAPPDVGAEQK